MSTTANARGLRRERTLASPRFRDGVFHNTHAVAPGLQKGTTVATMRDFFFGGQRRVPTTPLPSVDPRPTWACPVETGLRATWLGHSTVLLEIDGYRVLTDPVWGERISPFPMGPKRFQPVPIAIEGLPPLDAVIVSHDHFDHLDEPSIKALANAQRKVRFYTALGVGAQIAAWGIPEERIVELDWWESARIPHGDLELVAAPSQHFSGRGLLSRNTTLWSSFVVRGPKKRVFFSGDTGLTDEYVAIKERLGPFDLVMLEVGAFHPSWGEIHLGPANALTALERLGGGAFLPVHWGTFNLAIHAWDEPAEELVTLARPDTQLLMPRLGAPLETAREHRVEPWWRGIEGVADARLLPSGDV
jgi:L-ascorbate metabolism protein UlaG (beta-lactamase superfamily)